MSKIDVFDVTVSQLEEFAKVTYEDLCAYDLVGNYAVVTTWSWYGNQPESMMVACVRATKEEALNFASALDYNDLCANRMGITRSGNHYEVWHVVEDSIPSPSLDEFEGEGWYTVSYSDGGQDYTNDGPVWIEDVLSFVDLITGAMETATETHLPYAEYHGTGDLGEYVDDLDPQPVDWFGVMGDTLGDYPDEYTRALAEMF